MSTKSPPLRVVAVAPQDARPGADRADRYQTLWDSFTRYARVLNIAPQTIVVYGDAHRGLRSYLESNGLSTDPDLIRREHVEGYLGELLTRLRPSTAKLRHSSLRRWFNWLVDEGEIERSPLERVKPPRVEDGPAPTLSMEALEALLGACEGRGFEERRDRALIRLMLDCGLRRQEAASVTMEDVDMDRQVIHVVVKGNRPEMAKYGAKAALDLDRYLRARDHHPLAHMTIERPANHPLAPLSVGPHGGRVRPLWLGARGRVTDDVIHAIIKRRARRAGLDERTVHPHLLRHTFAHMVKGAGASDEITMDLGRWRDVKTMRRYGRGQAVERAHAAHQALSPGDRV